MAAGGNAWRCGGARPWPCTLSHFSPSLPDTPPPPPPPPACFHLELLLQSLSPAPSARSSTPPTPPSTAPARLLGEARPPHPRLLVLPPPRLEESPFLGTLSSAASSGAHRCLPGPSLFVLVPWHRGPEGDRLLGRLTNSVGAEFCLRGSRHPGGRVYTSLLSWELLAGRDSGGLISGSPTPSTGMASGRHAADLCQVRS